MKLYFKIVTATTIIGYGSILNQFSAWITDFISEEKNIIITKFMSFLGINYGKYLVYNIVKHNISKQAE